jgi:Holliday junction resolvase-like predicted endonuclease
MKKFTSKKQKLGEVGEKNAEMFLLEQGFSIVEKNYSNRFGEIDLITLKNNHYHFIEVKTITVSHETSRLKNEKNTHNNQEIPEKHNVSRETLEKYREITKKIVSRETFITEYRKILNPFQNISKSKIKKLIKTIEIYLIYQNMHPKNSWQIDGMGVFLDSDQNFIKCDYIEHINIK